MAKNLALFVYACFTQFSRYMLYERNISSNLVHAFSAQRLKFRMFLFLKVILNLRNILIHEIFTRICSAPRILGIDGNVKKLRIIIMWNNGLPFWWVSTNFIFVKSAKRLNQNSFLVEIKDNYKRHVIQELIKLDCIFLHWTSKSNIQNPMLDIFKQCL